MNYRNRNINPNISLIEALKKMDNLSVKLLIVEENGNFHGLLSVGDIQRAIIKNKPLTIAVKDVLRKNIRVGKEEYSIEIIKNMMMDYRMELCPVLNSNDEIVNIYFWEDLFGIDKPNISVEFNLPVVIMAGGLGTRLKPFTNVIPKPLIPLGDITILEKIIYKFSMHGCNRFYLSVNYKSDLIKLYIKSKNLPFTINYFEEDKPMGTAGSIGLLKGQISETFFLSNCDILINQDYSEILEYHRENKNEITVVAAMKHYPIAYGTVETGENGKLIGLTEKPEFTIKINSGMYILESSLINEIPADTYFHITDLIHKVITRNGKVGVFPVSEKSLIDVGELESYLKIIKADFN